MAKKDNNEEEYNENLDNTSSNDDEDFGLPDLDDDASEVEDTDDVEKDEETFELPSEEEVESITFDSSDEEEDDSSEYVTEDAIVDDYNEEVDEEDGEAYQDTEDEYDDDEDEEAVAGYTPPKQSNAPIVITLSIIVILACLAVYFIFFRDSPKPEVVEKPKEDTVVAVVEKPVEVEPVIEEPVEEVPEEAVINTLNTRTGRSYVVVGSFFDDDLAMDYAKTLKKNGTSSYVIPPFGKSKFTRVAVEETSSFSDASTIANELAGQYKEQPWPLKY